MTKATEAARIAGLKALLDEHFRKVEKLVSWAEFAHDTTCGYLEMSDEPYARRPDCNCGRDEVLDTLGLSETRQKLAALLQR